MITAPALGQGQFSFGTLVSMSKERVAIYIDGSNFYHYLKDKEISFPEGVAFDYSAFAEYIVGDRGLVSKRYYTGIFRNLDDTKKSKQLVRGQQKFLSKLQNEGFAIKRGKIMYDVGRPREKGTDVKIAVDMLVGAVDDIYDTAVIVSSDTDLIPALQYIRFKKKRVEYVGFGHAPSFGMQKHVDISRLLTKEDIEKFKKQ